jgi:anthranilate synthase/aminodeoxychorismate synthase-like glutamine amidotransferase
MLVIDNYDSFTYNLVQILASKGVDVDVRRNDALRVEDLKRLDPDALVISPGPGTPKDAGISVDAVRHLAGRVPILGVCLGHQCIAHAFGGGIVQARRIMHGKISLISHDGTGIFSGVPVGFHAVRYHSLAVEEASLPEILRVCARTFDDGEIMGLCNEGMRLYGVQFHPESIATDFGDLILERFIDLAGRDS